MREMVSSSFNKGSRFCPALDAVISAERCGRDRLSRIECPLSCPFNPFNPDAPSSFDSVFGRGLKSAGRWIEKALGPVEWSRRYREMERRFSPEDDVPLISFEAEWAALNSFSAEGEPLRDRIDDPGSGLRNDTRIVLRKLGESRVYMLETLPTDEGLPYYNCRDMIRPELSFRYVDFGEQEPLEVGAVLFGRFIEHDGCLYVVPGIFVGSKELAEEFMSETELTLGASGAALDALLQSQLPEVWNLCAEAQDAFDEVELGPLDDEGALEEPEEMYKAVLKLREDKREAVLALRRHALFAEEDPKEFGIDLFEATVFQASIVPSDPFDEADNSGEENAFEEDEELGEDEPVRVGTVYVEQDQIVVTAYNAVEMELLKALVLAIAPCEE